jgi:hypothetical protein
MSERSFFVQETNARSNRYRKLSFFMVFHFEGLLNRGGRPINKATVKVFQLPALKQ